MQRILFIAEQIALYLSRIGGLMMLACALLIVVEVFLRKFANYSIQGIDEYSGYALSISVALSLPYALITRSHIRVDALYNALPTGFKIALDWFSIFAVSAFAAFLVYTCYDVFAASLRFEYTSNTPLSTPLWIPQTIWLFGFIMFLFTSCVIFLCATFYCITGKFNEVIYLVGGKSVNEELKEEMSKKN